MPNKCLRCEESIGDLYSICTDCAKDLFSDNIFWISASPIIGSPIIDRYREDSEPTLRIGDLPGDEVEFKPGQTILEQIQSYKVEEMDADDYSEIHDILDTTLAEIGVQEDFNPDSYIFSKEDIKVFSEIFYLLEEMEHKFTKEEGRASLYNRIGNLFFFTALKADRWEFEPDFREQITDNLETEAEGYYQMAVNVEENNEISKRNMGMLFLEMGRYTEARVKFESVLETEFTDIESNLGLIRSLIKLGELNTAMNYLTEIADDNQDNKEVWFLRADLAREQGRWGGAIQYYNRALEIDRFYEEAYLGKGNVLLEKEMFSQANDHFDSYIEEDESNARIWFGKGKALLGMGKWGGAIQCINEALMLDPQLEEAWILKGEILLDNERYESANDAFESALKLNPENKRAKEGKREVKENL